MKLCSLQDLGQIGKHYLIKSTSHSHSKTGGTINSGTFDPIKSGIKRQYTECFAMRRDIYDNLLKIAMNMNSS